MLKIKAETLDAGLQSVLDSLQSTIDLESNFSDRVSKAKSQWKAKDVGNFGLIRGPLERLCISVELCNYCEQNEATDIEHIAPKSFFPSDAFKWDNYILACKTCNSGYKLDKVDQFIDSVSNLFERLPRGSEPSCEESAFINPRKEDPMNYMKLDLRDFFFYTNDIHQINSREHSKVESTLKILELNDRPSLVHHRRFAFGNFKRLLSEYAKSKKATNAKELEAALCGDPEVDLCKPFEVEKIRVLHGIIDAIKKSAHITVWLEILRQKSGLPSKMVELLDENPEASGWITPS